MKEYTVAKVDEVKEGSKKLVVVNGTEIVVLRHQGAYYAVGNTCPHEGNALCDGDVRDCTIVCPTHEWEFSLKTGESDDHPGFQADTYPIRVDGAELKISI